MSSLERDRDGRSDQPDLAATPAEDSTTWLELLDIDSDNFTNTEQLLLRILHFLVRINLDLHTDIRDRLISMSSTIELQIKPRGKKIKRLPTTVTTSPSVTAADLHDQIATAARTSDSRLRITKATDNSVIPNSRDVKISATGLKDGDVIQIKDLGPQIAWRTVFIIEYLGPILIHPLVFALRSYIYSPPDVVGKVTGTLPTASSLQILSMLMIILHFLKREYETVFVHRFSSSTMPAFNIFKNSAHYWLLSGLNIAYWTYSPTSPTQTRSLGPIAYLGLALYIFGELANYNTHITLQNLRPEGSTARGIPRGFGFNLVTCPNYLFEMLAWTGIWLVNFSFSTGVFAVIAGGQMAAWAMKKERRYRTEFGDKYKRKRFAMIPGLV